MLFLKRHGSKLLRVKVGIGLDVSEGTFIYRQIKTHGKAAKSGIRVPLAEPKN